MASKERDPPPSYEEATKNLPRGPSPAPLQNTDPYKPYPIYPTQGSYPSQGLSSLQGQYPSTYPVHVQYPQDQGTYTPQMPYPPAPPTRNIVVTPQQTTGQETQRKFVFVILVFLIFLFLIVIMALLS